MVTLAMIPGITLAVLPVVVPIALVLALIGTAAAALFKKGGGGAAPAGIGGGGGGELPPAPEGAFVTVKQQGPTVKLHSGEVRKPSEAWAWSTSSGAGVQKNGVGGSASEAVMSMLESFRTDAGADFTKAPITGLVGGGGAPTYAFGLDANDQWSITLSEPPQPGKLPPPPKMIASGPITSWPQAVLMIFSELSKHVPWLGMSGSEGAPVPSPTPNAPLDPLSAAVRSFHGLTIVSKPPTVAVVSLSDWMGYIAPHINALLMQTADADKIMDDVLGANMPDNTKINGKALSHVRKVVQEIVDKYNNGEWISVASPDEYIAAAIVGSTFAPDGFATRYKDHAIVARQIGATTWEYLIWKGSRGLDTKVLERGEEGSKNLAIKRARARIDLGFPKVLGPNECPPGLVPTIKNGTRQCLPPPGVGVPKIDDCKAIAKTWSKNLSTTPINWYKSTETALDIFKAYGTCESFLIRIGVCIYPIKGSVGKLGAANSVTINDFAITESDGDKVAALTFQHLEPGDLARAWKRQFEAKVHRVGNGIELDSFSTVDSIDELDACPTRPAAWPSKTYLIWGTGHDKVSWDPRPKYTATVSGASLRFAIKTIGLPHFVKMPPWPQGGGGFAIPPMTYFADPITLTTYRVAVKGWSIGL